MGGLFTERTVCLRRYDRDFLLYIRDTTSECDIQPNVGHRDLEFLLNCDTIHANNACGVATN